MDPKVFTEQLKAMMDQHIILIKNSSHILEENLKLMRENDELRRKIK